MTERVAKKELGPEARVRRVYPDAHVVDDGSWVYIYNQKTVAEVCPLCKQSWIRKVTDYGRILGSGGSEDLAWQNAAKNL